MSYFTTGGPSKEHGTNKPPPNGRILGKVKKMPHVVPPPRILLTGIHLGWAMHGPPGWTGHQEGLATRKDWSEWLSRSNPETNSITIKPETASHRAEQSSWVPLPSWSPPRHAFPIKSLALSACVLPQTIDFWVLDKSPFGGPRRSPTSCNTWVWLIC